LLERLKKRRVHLLYKQYKETQTKIEKYINRTETYLNQTEQIKSSEDAKYHYDLYTQYHQEKENILKLIEDWKAKGKEIYGHEYSDEKWRSRVTEQENLIVKKIGTIETRFTTKKEILADHVTREEHVEAVGYKKLEFQSLYKQIKSWEVHFVESVQTIKSTSNGELEARVHLELFEMVQSQSKTFQTEIINQFLKLGNEIIESSYKSSHSEWSEDNSDIKNQMVNIRKSAAKSLLIKEMAQ